MQLIIPGPESLCTPVAYNANHQKQRVDSGSLTLQAVGEGASRYASSAYADFTYLRPLFGFAACEGAWRRASLILICRAHLTHFPGFHSDRDARNSRLLHFCRRTPKNVNPPRRSTGSICGRRQENKTLSFPCSATHHLARDPPFKSRALPALPRVPCEVGSQ